MRNRELPIARNSIEKFFQIVSLSPEFEKNEEGHLIRRYLLKYRRWKANKWKHDLCFNDSRWSAFWTGIWGHLLKPASI